MKVVKVKFTEPADPKNPDAQRDGVLSVTNGDGTITEWGGPMNPPTSGDLRALVEAWKAEGGKPEEYEDPQPVPAIKSWPRAMDFKLEFTDKERQAMRGLAKKDLVAEDFLDLLSSAGRVVANDPLLLQGLGYMVSKNVLTQARVTEVLTKPSGTARA